MNKEFGTSLMQHYQHIENNNTSKMQQNFAKIVKLMLKCFWL